MRRCLEFHSSKYRERYSIRCSRSIDYRASAVVGHRADCVEELERYTQCDGLPHEVRLRGAVSIEDATAYLDYLFAYEFPHGAQARILEMLLKIQSVDKSLVRGQLDFHASFNHSGCNPKQALVNAMTGDFL